MKRRLSVFFATVCATFAAFAGCVGSAAALPTTPSSGSPIVATPQLPAPPSFTRTHKSSQPQVTITSVGSPVLAPGTPLRITVNVSNPSTSPLTLTHFDLRAAYSSPLNDQNIRDWMRGNLDSAPVARDSSPLTVPPGGSEIRTISVEAKDLTWDTSQFGWGPRGILVRATTDQGEYLSDTSFIIVAPKVNLQRTPTTVVAPLVRSAHNIAQQGTLSDFLAQARPLRVAPEPTTKPTPTPQSEKSKASGKTDHETNTAPEGNDISSPGDLFAQVPAFIKEPEDIGAMLQLLGQAQKGMEFLVDPTLQASSRFTEAVSQRDHHFLPTFDASITSFTAAHRPTLASAAMSEGNSVTYGLTDSASLKTAKDAGFTAGIVSSRDFFPHAELTYTPSAYVPAKESELPSDVYVFDQSLSDTLAGYMPGAGPVTSGASASSSHTSSDSQSKPVEKVNALDSRQLALTVSAMQYRERPNDQRGIIAAFPRGTDIRTETARSLLQAPWAMPASLEDQKKTAASGEYLAREKEPSTNVVNADTLRHLQQARHSLAAVANATPFSTDLNQLNDLYTSLAAAQISAGGPSTAALHIDHMTIASTAHLEVKVAETSTINMISEASSIPLRVINPLPFPINAQVVLRMPDQRLRADSPAPAAIPAKNSATISIPVKAYGSGDLDVEAHVETPGGEVLSSRTSLNIRVRAQWENVGTVVIGSLVVILFATGVVKSVRKGRRSHPVSADEFGENVKRSSGQLSG
ncbi:DUF6049 family protein [Arcanobacterium canis]